MMLTQDMLGLSIILLVHLLRKTENSLPLRLSRTIRRINFSAEKLKGATEFHLTKIMELKVS